MKTISLKAGDLNRVFDERMYRMKDIMRFTGLSRPVLEEMLKGADGAKKIRFTGSGKNLHWVMTGVALKRFMREKLIGDGFIG